MDEREVGVQTFAISAYLSNSDGGGGEGVFFRGGGGGGGFGCFGGLGGFGSFTRCFFLPALPPSLSSLSSSPSEAAPPGPRLRVDGLRVRVARVRAE